MQIIKTAPGSQITIGRQGEQNARQVRFDLNAWLADFDQTGVVELIFQRPGDSAPFPVETLREGEELVWNITDVDTANAGTNGKAELRYYLDGALLKSAISPVTVDKAMGTPGQVPESPGQDWLDQALAVGAQAKSTAAKVEEATKHAPYIGYNGNWFVWDAGNERFEDTGRFSGGETPYIGSNGNWFVGGEDTGVSTTGPQGPKGDPGEGATIDATLTQEGQAADAKTVGDKVNQLSDEKLDKTALPTAVNDALAQAKASGEFDGAPGQDGADGSSGEDGYSPTVALTETDSGVTITVTNKDGQQTANVKNGKDGADGKTPEKGVDYFTEADKSELVNDVLAALPAWTGGAY